MKAFSIRARAATALLAALAYAAPAIGQESIPDMGPPAEDAIVEAVFPDGSSFGMTPFEGSYVATAFTGFFREDNISSVTINESPPEQWGELVEAFTNADTLASIGVTAETSEKTTILGLEALRVAGTQSANGRVIPKCIILLKGEEKVGILAAQIAQPGPQDTDACALIQGIAIRAPAGLDDKLSALPFALTDTGGLRLVNVLGGSGALFTLGPLDIVKAAEQPVLIVASSLAPAAVGQDRNSFAVTQIESLALHSIETITGIGDTRFAGLPAVEIFADAVHDETGEAIKVGQWIAFAGDGTYVRVIGLTRSDQWEATSGRFMDVINGLVWPRLGEPDPQLP